MDTKTKEIQYQALIETANQDGVSSLGLMTNQICFLKQHETHIFLYQHQWMM